MKSFRAVRRAAASGALLTTLLFVSSGCRSKPEAPPVDPGEKAAAPAAGEEKPEGVIERSQVDVLFDASLEGDHIKISILNKTQAEMLVGPKNFAFIPPGSHNVIPFRGGAAKFPPSTLEPGEQIIGLLPMSGFPGMTTDGRIVFKHPLCQPALAEITR